MRQIKETVPKLRAKGQEIDGRWDIKSSLRVLMLKSLILICRLKQAMSISAKLKNKIAHHKNKLIKKKSQQKKSHQMIHHT